MSDDVKKESEVENSSVEEMSDKDKLIESEDATSSKLEVEETESKSKQAFHNEKPSSKSKVGNEKPTLKKDVKKQKLSKKEDTSKEKSASKRGVYKEESTSKENVYSQESISKQGINNDKSSSQKDVNEDSSTEPFEDKPSEEDYEETASEEASGDSTKKDDLESDEDDEPKQHSSRKEPAKVNRAQEEREDREEFKDNMKILLKTVIEREKVLKRIPFLLPCDSCEFSVDPTDSEIRWCCWGRVQNKCVSPKMIRVFWIVSAPADQTPQETFDKLNKATAPSKLSINFKLHIPDLKFGTIDDLIYVSASLAKLDGDAGQVVKNLVDFMKTIIKDDLRTFLEDNDLDVINYMTRFSWNSVKYPKTRPLTVLKDVIRSQMWNMEDNLKARSDELGYLDKTLEQLEKDNTGGLVNRPLTDIVKREDVVLGSKRFTTLMVVVAAQLEKEWLKSYTNLAEMVVPGSSSELYSDKEHKLFSVVVGKKCVEEFKTSATKKKFVVRDFEYSDDVTEDAKETQKNVEDLRKEFIEILTRWLKVKFNETFTAWIHVKVMRCFVESVLKFGMKPRFQAMVLVPQKEKSLRKKLDDMYADIDRDLCVGQIKDAPGGLENIGGKIENTKYVFLTVPVHFISKGKE
ncbi:hypothetical protein JTE90_019314 [Oedothorax gibbosus]|uniref:V-type proton ATPase subunit C n=1 Tax=Oedothorax gibbosus TaxID=931172 RepID=A0AAV6TW70_9ARAC|nr:hypothetical protein JTE90_019314 [Oedothorax gibbosus]